MLRQVTSSASRGHRIANNFSYTITTYAKKPCQEAATDVSSSPLFPGKKITTIHGGNQKSFPFSNFGAQCSPFFYNFGPGGIALRRGGTATWLPRANLNIHHDVTEAVQSRRREGMAAP